MALKVSVGLLEWLFCWCFLSVGVVLHGMMLIFRQHYRDNFEIVLCCYCFVMIDRVSNYFVCCFVNSDFILLSFFQEECLE